MGVRGFGHGCSQGLQGLRRKIKLGARNWGLREKWTRDRSLGPERGDWGPGCGFRERRGLGARTPGSWEADGAGSLAWGAGAGVGAP